MSQVRSRLSYGLLVVGVAVAGRMWTAVPMPLIAQEDVAPPPRAVSEPVPVPDPRVPAYDLNPSISSPIAEPATDPAAVQRQRLLKLYTRKLELLDEAQLTEEARSAERAVAELEAARKLEALQQSLSELTEMYPGTAAAATAQRMLQTARIVPDPLNPANLRLEFTAPSDASAPPFSPNPTNRGGFRQFDGSHKGSFSDPAAPPAPVKIENRASDPFDKGIDASPLR